MTAMRTSVRMTSDGSPYTRFHRALATGNLYLVRTAAAELPQVQLSDALQILPLMRDDEVLYERAALRWIGRFCLECNTASLEEVEAVGQALRLLLDHPGPAMDTLAEVCSANGLGSPTGASTYDQTSANRPHGPPRRARGRDSRA